MTVVVLGSTGMLGHVVTVALRERGFQVVAQGRSPLGWPPVDDGLRVLDVEDRPALAALLAETAPCTVVNCVGARPGSAAGALTSLNSELPRWLAHHLDANRWGRLVHVSTDGVFSTERHAASEDDLPDPADDYGRTKLAGEVTHEPHLTVRTSIVGPERRGRSGLLEWFRTGEGPVNGFTRVLWNGVTTLELARFVGLCQDRQLSGLVHLGGETVSKRELLALLGRVFRVDREIRPDPAPRSVRTLSSRRCVPGYTVPPLPVMLEELERWEARLAARESR